MFSVPTPQQGRGQPLACGTARSRSVDWRLAGRAGLPAAVHPEPLRGVAADGVLQYGVEAGGVGGGVGFGVAGGGQCDFGIEVEDVATLGLVPEEKAGEDGSAGLERDAGEAGGGAGRNAEELDINDSTQK